MKKAVKKVVKPKKEAVQTKNEISELRKLAYTFASIVAIFLIFYGIAYLKTNKGIKNNDNVEKTIQYEEIILGNLLNRNETSYYVLVYNDQKDYNTLYNTLITEYEKEENALPIFYIDMNNAFNEPFKNEVNDFSNNVSELKIKEDVLFLIKDSKISAHYTGDSIASTLIK